jgi:hypothetical protein
LDVVLPSNFPTGPVEVLLVFASKGMPLAQKENEAEIFKLAGSLKNSTHFSGDPLVIQKALRDYWQR